MSERPVESLFGQLYAAVIRFAIVVFILRWAVGALTPLIPTLITVAIVTIAGSYVLNRLRDW